LWGLAIQKKNEPINGTAKIIHMGLNCQPCYASTEYQECLDYKCMNDITVNEVMYNVRQKING